MFAEVNGVNLFYEKTGTGRPLIMVHGNGEDHRIFKEAAEVLKRKYTCYLLDSRCHGQSSSTKELHYEDMAQDVIAFMEELNLYDVIFYGFSDGGIIGLLASSLSGRITTLITSGANVRPEGVKKGVTVFFKILYFFKKDKKIALMLNEPHISDDRLRMIKARTLVAAGSKDLILPEETKHIAETIPGAELNILDGESHGSYIIHKTKVAELIDEFASRMDTDLL